MDEERRYTIAVGNPFDGIKLHGLFESHDDALEHIEQNGNDWNEVSWHIVQIEEL